MPPRLLRLLLLLFPFLSLLLLILHFRHPSNPHHLLPHLFPSNLSLPLSPQQHAHLCRRHGFPSTPPPHPRRVYDLFLLSTELDWLEIRLHTLAPVVDYFVVVESPTTFTARPKPLHLQDNWHRFRPFHSQLIHIVVHDPVQSTRTWDHEDFFRNALLHRFLPAVQSTPREPLEGDVLIVSDIDEIPKPQSVHLLRHCDFPDRLTLQSHFYYYSFQWLHRGPQWPHPQATHYHGPNTTLPPQTLRIDDPSPTHPWLLRPYLRWRHRATLGSAAWHCSSCFATLADMRAKMSAFSHTSYDTAANRDAATIVSRVQDGADLFGRPDERYDRVHPNLDVPRHVLDHPRRFDYLLDRDGDTAAFRDLDMADLHA